MNNFLSNQYFISCLRKDDIKNKQSQAIKNQTIKKVDHCFPKTQNNNVQQKSQIRDHYSNISTVRIGSNLKANNFSNKLKSYRYLQCSKKNLKIEKQNNFVERMYEDFIRRNLIGNKLRELEAINSKSEISLLNEQLNKFEQRMSSDISRRFLSRCSIHLLSDDNKSNDERNKHSSVEDINSFYERQLDFLKHKMTKIDCKRREDTFEKLSKEEHLLEGEKSILKKNIFHQQNLIKSITNSSFGKI